MEPEILSRLKALLRGKSVVYRAWGHFSKMNFMAYRA